MSRGVRFYEYGTLVYRVPFPDGKRVCMNCLFCYSEHGLERARCRISGEILSYPHTERGQECPIYFTEEDIENER